MPFRTRSRLVGQRTQLVNALRVHLAEHGIVVRRGVGNIARPAAMLEEAEVPALVKAMSDLSFARIERIGAEIGALDRRIAATAKMGDVMHRPQTAPGIGPVCAMAIATVAPDMRAFRSGRDVAAWLGLVPRKLSSGGRQKAGRISKMGQRDIRRLLIAGAMAIVHWRGRDGGRPGSWLSRRLARKPRMLVAVAPANRMARMIRAMPVRHENYRDPVGAVCSPRLPDRRRSEENNETHVPLRSAPGSCSA